MRCHKRYLLLLVLLQTVMVGWCQSTPVNQLDSLAGRMVRAVRAVREDRAYIKTDRYLYSTGDKIWFRTFIVNEYTGRLSNKNTLLFVDLVNDKDSVISKALLQSSQFKTDGYLSLNDSLPTGLYWLRAYTKDLAMHHKEHIGVEAIYIVNPTKSTEKLNTQSGQQTSSTGKLRMDFFPEGGAVIGGAKTLMAFRITDDKGTPQAASGFVKDDHDSLVTSFSSNALGLGKLSFFSWSWRKYNAHIITSDKQEKIFALPSINLFAAQLSVINNKDVKKLRVVLEDSIYQKNKQTYIIGVSGDSLCFAGIGSGSYEVIIPEYRFPYGPANFLLFDEQQHLLSERKLFISANKPRVEMVADKAVYAARQPVQLSMQVTDADNHSFISSMFIKVIDSILAEKIKPVIDLKQQSLELSDVNAFTAMDQPFSEEDMDLLMLTQQHSFRQILTAGLDPQSSDIETDSSFYLRGLVLNKNGKPLSNKEITLFSGNRNALILHETTDKSGAFCFPLISYYDQTKFNLQVTDKNGIPEDVKIKVDTVLKFPLFGTPEVLKKRFTVEKVKEFFTEQRKRSVQDTIMMGKEWLKEVIVRSTIKKPSEFNRDKRVSSFSKILSGKMLLNGGNNNIGDALFRIPGFSIREGKLVLRGGNAFHGPGVGAGSDEPLLIVDGVAVTPDAGDLIPGSPLVKYLNTFSFRNIDFIEVLTGPEAAFYGSRAFNGVVLVHTKTTQTEIGDEPVNGIQSFVMPGYQLPVAFEQPDYSLKENRNSKLPDRRTLLYWNGDLVTDAKGKASTVFYTADTPTRYYITLTGVTADGRVVNKQLMVNRQ